MQQDRHVQFDGPLEQPGKLRFVGIPAGEVRVEQDALHAELRDAAIQLHLGGLLVLQRQHAQPEEPRGMSAHDAGRCSHSTFCATPGPSGPNHSGPGSLMLNAVRPMPLASMSASFASTSAVVGQDLAVPVAHFHDPYAVLAISRRLACPFLQQCDVLWSISDGFGSRWHARKHAARQFPAHCRPTRPSLRPRWPHHPTDNHDVSWLLPSRLITPSWAVVSRRRHLSDRRSHRIAGDLRSRLVVRSATPGHSAPSLLLSVPRLCHWMIPWGG